MVINSVLPPNELSRRGVFMKNPTTLMALGLGIVRTLIMKLSKIISYPLSSTCSN